jgi:hypothetical protein
MLKSLEDHMPLDYTNKVHRSCGSLLFSLRGVLAIYYYGGMYQRLIIGEADARVCVSGHPVQNKGQPRKKPLTLESLRDYVIHTDNM